MTGVDDRGHAMFFRCDLFHLSTFSLISSLILAFVIIPRPPLQQSEHRQGSPDSSSIQGSPGRGGMECSGHFQQQETHLYPRQGGLLFPGTLHGGTRLYSNHSKKFIYYSSKPSFNLIFTPFFSATKRETRTKTKNRRICFRRR